MSEMQENNIHNSLLLFNSENKLQLFQTADPKAKQAALERLGQEDSMFKASKRTQGDLVFLNTYIHKAPTFLL